MTESVLTHLLPMFTTVVDALVVAPGEGQMQADVVKIEVKRAQTQFV